MKGAKSTPPSVRERSCDLDVLRMTLTVQSTFVENETIDRRARAARSAASATAAHESLDSPLSPVAIAPLEESAALAARTRPSVA